MWYLSKSDFPSSIDTELFVFVIVNGEITHGFNINIYIIFEKSWDMFLLELGNIEVFSSILYLVHLALNGNFFQGTIYSCIKPLKTQTALK